MSATENGAYITLSERRRILLEKYLQKRVGYTKKQLMKILADELSDIRDGGDFSLRTINSDLDYLTDCGAEIDKQKRKVKNKAGRTVTEYYYSYINSKWTYRKLDFDPDAMQNIKVAAEILKQIPGLQLHKDLVDVYEKLDSYSEPYIDKRTYIQFDTRPGYIGNKHLVEIIEACKTGSVISFDYKPFKSDEPKSVIVHPYLLKEYNNRWFLIGMTETSIEEKKYEISQFGLERIHGKIKNTGAEYYYHNNFNPDEYLANIIGVFIKAGEEVENIELRFKIDRARYVETNPLHQSQILVNETKTHKTFFYQLIPNPELEALILSYGGDAEVLKPESLRNKIADKLKTARDLYF